MRLTLLAVSLLGAAGCGGAASPELYAMVLDFATAPASCFQNPPTQMTTQGPLVTLQTEVWDGPESKAYLVPSGAGFSIDMGDAPTIQLTAGTALEGTNGATGWSFVTDRNTTNTILGTVTTTKTHIGVAFTRANTAKGTLSLSSSQTCTGGGCPTTMPACAFDIGLRITRLQVDYLKTP